VEGWTSSVLHFVEPVEQGERSTVDRNGNQIGGSMKQALFLDRDGVINEEVGYLHRMEDVRFMPGIVRLLHTARELGMFVCVITNQAGIGRGLYSEADFQTLMKHMRAALAVQGAFLDAVYHSPFHPEHGLGEYRRDTECRKPKPGMLLQAAKDHDLDLRRSVLVGDRCSDLAAGAAAGVPDLFLVGNMETCSGVSHRAIPGLEQVVNYLLSMADGVNKVAV
jgi:D-glycero-D-manno-heptose 1,7-bisphosphate phosphatase